MFEGHGTNEPPAIIVRDVSGEDPSISGLTPEQITAQFDAEDYVSGVELLTQAQGSSQQAQVTDTISMPFKHVPLRLEERHTKLLFAQITTATIL